MAHTPIPRSLAERHEALHHTVRLCVDAFRHNANPYRKPDTRIDTTALIPGLLELYLGEEGPQRPAQIDTFSTLVGAAIALAVTVHRDSTDWITEPPSQ